ncbi:MAG: type IX secretion system membrane protein PorP/SprF, partial [Bacteroidota bacterium]
MKQYYHIFGFFGLLAFSFSLHAQQLAQYSLYFLDPVQLNPAYAGLDNSLSATGTYRSQWSGLPGNPVGQRLSAHLPLYIISSGIGFDAEIDELGARRYTRFGLSYNYQLVRGRSVWSLGV